MRKGRRGHGHRAGGLHGQHTDVTGSLLSGMLAVGRSVSYGDLPLDPLLDPLVDPLVDPHDPHTPVPSTERPNTIHHHSAPPHSFSMEMYRMYRRTIGGRHAYVSYCLTTLLVLVWRPAFSPAEYGRSMGPASLSRLRNRYQWYEGGGLIFVDPYSTYWPCARSHDPSTWKRYQSGGGRDFI